ncbi:PD40 domain-containing protein [Candidatus Sumerlaeota bacterium]|nr:PD40 domain-containing protein [Candidatus Sumerlaeota bacterium]
MKTLFTMKRISSGFLCVFFFLNLFLYSQTPDCGSILAAYNGENGFGIYRFNAPDYKPTLFVRGFGFSGWCNMPRVSSDLNTLYFTTKTPDNNATVLARLDLENPKAKPELLPLGQEVKPGMDFVYAAPHPSGKWLVGSMRLSEQSPDHDLFRLDLSDDASQTEIHDFFHSPAWEGLPSFSLDGKKIAFIQSAFLDPGTYEDGASSRAQQLVVADVSPDRVAFNPLVFFKASRFVEMPQWSPDGKNIVIQVSAFTDDYDIIRVDVDSRKWEVLTRSPHDDYNPTYSVDGKWIIYAQKLEYKTTKNYPDPLDRGEGFYGNRILAIPENGGDPILLFQSPKKISFLWFPQAIK